MINQLTLFREEDNTKNSAYLLIIFFLWPFIGFILACANIKKSLNKKLIIAFFALYGLLFFINPLMDGQRRAENLKAVHREPFSNLQLVFGNLYEDTLDVAEPLIMFTVSRFTDFYGVLFAVYAILFGGLMLYYLSKVYQHYTLNRNINTALFFLLLICVNPIFNINGFRMWMAAWIFAVAVINYLEKGKKKYILLSAFSFLMHFSFLPAVAILVIYAFFKNKPKIYGILAIVTLFVVEIDIATVREYAAILGSASESKVDSYTNEQHIEKVAELGTQSAWYIQLTTYGLKYFTMISLLIIFFKTRAKFNSKLTANFYSFSLLFLCFANVSALLPSGGRFYTVFYIFSFTTLLMFYVYENRQVKLSIPNWIGLPIAASFALFTIRLFSESASGYLFAPSLFLPFGLIENFPLRSMIF